MVIERAVRKKVLTQKPYREIDYVLALDDVGYQIGLTDSRLSVLKETSTNAKLREAAIAALKVLEQWMVGLDYREDVFKAVAMPFVTVSGRGYYNRQEVWDLINVLTALHNPADNLRLAAALRSNAVDSPYAGCR